MTTSPNARCSESNSSQTGQQQAAAGSIKAFIADSRQARLVASGAVKIGSAGRACHTRRRNRTEHRFFAASSHKYMGKTRRRVSRRLAKISVSERRCYVKNFERTPYSPHLAKLRTSGVSRPLDFKGFHVPKPPSRTFMLILDGWRRERKTTSLFAQGA